MPQTASKSLLSQKGDGLLVLWGDIDPATTDEDDLNDWWTNEHLPERLRLPGFFQAHRYRALNPKTGKKNYLTCYEASNVQDLASSAYMWALNNPTERTKKFMPCLAAMNRSSCSVLLSSSRHVLASEPANNTGNFLVLLVFNSSSHDSVEDRLIQSADTIMKDWTSLHIARQDDEITKAGSSSRSYDGVKFEDAEGLNDGASKRHILLITLGTNSPNTSASQMEDVQTGLTSFVNELHQIGVVPMYQGAYELMCSMDEDMLNH